MPYSPGLTLEQKVSVSTLYRTDPSPTRVAALLGLSLETVRHHLKKTGEAKPRRIVTEAMRGEMVYRYDRGESSWEIAKAMGFLNVCVIKNLGRAGIKLRDRSTAAKTYSVKQDYFEKIDTPSKAYLLGLIWADGNISGDSFTLALKASDKLLLEQIREEISSTGPLNFRKRQQPQMSDMWALRVHDKRFCSHLRALGVIERKTSKLRFPFQLEKRLYAPFILGVIDGDGTISDMIKGKPRLTFGIAGSEQMLLDLQRLINSLLGVHMSFSRKPNSRGCALGCSSNVALTVLNWLYRNAPPFFMARKYACYARFTASLRNRKRALQSQTLFHLEQAEEILLQHAA